MKNGPTREPFVKPLLESKAVSNIKPLKDDRSEYRVWMEKFINAVSQSRPGSRNPLEAIIKHVVQGDDITEIIELTEPLNEDIYTTLFD